jgi:hypothetical protein
MGVRILLDKCRADLILLGLLAVVQKWVASSCAEVGSRISLLSESLSMLSHRCPQSVLFVGDPQSL